MRLEHYSVEKLKQEILVIAGRHLDLPAYSVFFFGSRVAGAGNERSDIDIGIEGLGCVPADALRAIKNEIATIQTLYKIDVVDFFDVSPSFRDVAMQHVEFLTQRKTV